MKTPSFNFLRMFGIVLAGLLILMPAASAKKEGGAAPAGWTKGEKKGWDGGSMPPGLAKKEAHHAAKEAKKQGKIAEHDAHKAAKEARKAAKKAERPTRRIPASNAGEAP